MLVLHQFKIEGRMKRPEYVATIVKQYREAIDAYLKNTTVNAFEQRIKKNEANVQPWIHWWIYFKRSKFCG